MARKDGSANRSRNKTNKQDQDRKHKKRGSAGQNRAAGEEYLLKNETKNGVYVTDSGLHFEDLHVGDGAMPQLGDTVSIDQRAWLVNGTVIEDTFKIGRPDTCSLAECIAGYREGLLLMRVGGKARLTVPPHLAWGKKGVGNKIGPESVVIFDVWLRAVVTA